MKDCKMKQRHKLYLTIEHQNVEEKFVARNITHSDYQSLGNLMLEAYRDTVDYDGESLADSIGEIKGTLEGKYGTLIESASYIIETDGMSAAAVIFTTNEKEKLPLLTFAMTHPAFKNKGMSKYLIRKGLNSLLDLGYRECFLVVTDGNQPAQSMYEKMSFKAS
jgi:ribosomal protein S18 acetylase RimI-like enzyme